MSASVRVYKGGKERDHMIITNDSHCDHVSQTILDFVKERFAGKSAFFIEEVDLPDGLTAESGLYGPACGDPPVQDSDVIMVRRAGRDGDSRCVRRPMRQTGKLIVVAGPDDNGNPCVLYTCYGGPLAPREPWDPSLDDAGRAESQAFWSQHALAVPQIYFAVGNVAEHSGYVTSRDAHEAWSNENPSGWTYQDVCGPHGNLLAEGSDEASVAQVLDTWLECDSVEKGTYCYTHNPNVR